MYFTECLPYKHKESFSPIYQQAIKGYYLNLETFISLHETTKTYYIPTKNEWGMCPSDNYKWADYNTIKEQIYLNTDKKQSLLCWQKHEDSYLEFFIVWW